MPIVTNPFRLWSNVARDLAQQKRLSLAATARLFAMTFASMHDSVQNSQHAKAVYRLWRPETAIANADVDNNPATDADTTWVPLIPTPPYPAYPSNMTCIGTGASRMLANLLGSDAQTFSATWYTAANTVLWSEPYTSLWQLGNDEAWSRIWGGIHFRIDIDESPGELHAGGRLSVRQLHAAGPSLALSAPQALHTPRADRTEGQPYEPGDQRVVCHVDQHVDE